MKKTVVVIIILFIVLMIVSAYKKKKNAAAAAANAGNSNSGNTNNDLVNTNNMPVNPVQFQEGLIGGTGFGNTTIILMQMPQNNDVMDIQNYQQGALTIN